MEVHTQLRNDLNNNEIKKAIRNHPLIHATIIISVMDVTVQKCFCASDVDRKIILLIFF